jgi:hypothetical protein
MDRRFHHGRFYRCPNCKKRGWQEWRSATGKWRGVWGFDCRYCMHTSNSPLCVTQATNPLQKAVPLVLCQ